MLNLNSIIVFSEDPKKLADFYKKIFEKGPDWSGDDYYAFSIGNISIMFGRHNKVHGLSSNPERILINLETADIKGEFQRIKELGAKVIAQPYSPMNDSASMIATFADPDGNYFQLTTPWKDEMEPMGN